MSANIVKWKTAREKAFIRYLFRYEVNQRKSTTKSFELLCSILRENTLSKVTFEYSTQYTEYTFR